MTTELQLTAIAVVFLTWCLVGSLWTTYAPSADARLIWRDDVSDGWREVPFGLSSIDCAFLGGKPVIVDADTYAALLKIVLDERRLSSTTVRFAIIRTSRQKQTEVVFVSYAHATRIPNMANGELVSSLGVPAAAS
jgi:hypothetical protein